MDSSFYADGYEAGLEEGMSDFRLLHESEQGWSAVYSCLYRGRRIAIKILKEEYRNNELYRRLLYKEYAVGKLMSHPNIVMVLGFESLPDRGPAILMEYVDGVRLDGYIESLPKLNNAELLRIVEQICSAVSEIHSRQVVHCDIKPANIMITCEGGYVKLLDFGLSRGISFEQLDLPGGTEGFTAPENLEVTGKSSVATDIYSIGKIIEVMDKGRRFRSVVRLCTLEDPNKRPERVSEIPVLIKQKRKHPITVISIFGILVVGLCIGVFLWNSQKYDEVESQEPHKDLSKSIITTTVDTTSKGSEFLSDSKQIHDDFQAEMVSEIPEIDENGVTYSQEEEEDLRKLSKLDTEEYKLQMAFKLNSLIGRRFKQHLQLIDTMTTQHSNLLQQAGHWKWLARRDIRELLEKIWVDDKLMLEKEISGIDDEINFWASFSFRIQEEADRRRKAMKRDSSLKPPSLKEVFFKNNNTLVKRQFKEDGKWHTEVVNVDIPSDNPQELKKLQEEYIRKAMEE